MAVEISIPIPEDNVSQFACLAVKTLPTQFFRVDAVDITAVRSGLNALRELRDKYPRDHYPPTSATNLVYCPTLKDFAVDYLRGKERGEWGYVDWVEEVRSKKPDQVRVKHSKDPYEGFKTLQQGLLPCLTEQGYAVTAFDLRSHALPLGGDLVHQLKYDGKGRLVFRSEMDRATMAVQQIGMWIQEIGEEHAYIVAEMKDAEEFGLGNNILPFPIKNTQAQYPDLELLAGTL